jgi:hypothetical protein
MTNETIRIYTQSGFVFELSYDWVVTHMSEHRFIRNSDHKNLKNKMDILEYVRNLSWPEIMEQLKFVGIIEDSSQDTLKDSVLDLVDHPLNYATTKIKNMQFKLSKL